MSSPTLQTETIRHNKKVAQGRKRKNALKNKGTTKSQQELFKKVG